MPIFPSRFPRSGPRQRRGLEGGIFLIRWPTAFHNHRGGPHVKRYRLSCQGMFSRFLGFSRFCALASWQLANRFDIKSPKETIAATLCPEFVIETESPDVAFGQVQLLCSFFYCEKFRSTRHDHSRNIKTHAFNGQAGGG